MKMRKPLTDERKRPRTPFFRPRPATSPLQDAGARRHTVKTSCDAKVGISDRTFHTWTERSAPAFLAATQRAREIEGKGGRSSEKILDADDWRALAWYWNAIRPKSSGREASRDRSSSNTDRRRPLKASFPCPKQPTGSKTRFPSRVTSAATAEMELGAEEE